MINVYEQYLQLWLQTLLMINVYEQYLQLWLWSYLTTVIYSKMAGLNTIIE